MSFILNCKQTFKEKNICICTYKALLEIICKYLFYTYFVYFFVHILSCNTIYLMQRKYFFIILRAIPFNSYLLIYFNAFNVNSAVSRDYLQI